MECLAESRFMDRRNDHRILDSQVVEAGDK